MNFEKAKTFQNLLEANKRFIKGELFETPYHGGPLEIDSRTLKNKLLKLHKYQLLTVDGQAGLAGCEKNIKGMPGANQKSPKVPFTFNQKQKSYIDFYVPITQTNVDLINYMSMNDDILVAAYFKNSSKNYSNFDFTVQLTTSKVNDNKYKWDVDTILPAPSKVNMFNHALFGSLKTVMNNDLYMFVTMIVDNWCSEKTIEDYILEFFEK